MTDPGVEWEVQGVICDTLPKGNRGPEKRENLFSGRMHAFFHQNIRLGKLEIEGIHFFVAV